MINDSSLSTLAAMTAPNVVYQLALKVSGELSVDVTSIIDLTGKGYPVANYRGPDFTLASGYNCHGGNRSQFDNSSNDCSYGDYRHARYAGSAGSYYNAASPGIGGGAVMIEAGTMVLDGPIKANGLDGFYGGAGGSVHLVADQLSGGGNIEAIGADKEISYSHHAGGGGRISLISPDLSAYVGVVSVRGGSFEGDLTDLFVAGAGTFYRQDPNQGYGHLTVDNLARQSLFDSTPMPHANRHMITEALNLGDDQWQITIGTDGWTASNEYAGSGIKGIEVSLNAFVQQAPLYTVLSNTANSLLLSSTDDLATMVGNDLIGVHTFETLTLAAGSSLNFGDDRVVVLDSANSTIAGELSASINAAFFASELAITSGTRYQYHGDLRVGNSFNLDNGSSLVASQITAGSDLVLRNHSVISTHRATIDPKVLYPLSLDIAGQLSIDSTSMIDVMGKGYPAAHHVGPDFARVVSGNCHGGGIIDIQAASISLEGAIKANGEMGLSGGAGGSVHMVTNQLFGNGDIEATGADNIIFSGNHAGGGGRISLISADIAQYTGVMTTQGGSRDSEVSGAGTVYVQDPNQTYGWLSINNAGMLAATASTPIPHINRHTITDVTALADNQWQITIDSDGWTESSQYAGSGITGVEVSLDADDLLAPLYTVLSNSANTLLVATTDDLSGLVGNDLIGVHRFVGLEVIDGASADFGEDRVETVDGTPIVVSARSIVKPSVYFGDIKPLWATLNRRFARRLKYSEDKEIVVHNRVHLTELSN
jgi:hypothetical protein